MIEPTSEEICALINGTRKGMELQYGRDLPAVVLVNELARVCLIQKTQIENWKELALQHEEDYNCLLDVKRLDDLHIEDE